MARDASAAFRDAFLDRTTDKVVIALVAIKHSLLATPLRFALNYEPVVQTPASDTLQVNEGPGSTSINVNDSSEFEGFDAGEPIRIALNISGGFHETTLVSAGSNIVVIADGLPETVSAGQEISVVHTFIPYPFEIELPGASADRVQSARLRFDNIDRAIVQQLRQLNSPPTVEFQLVMSDQPNITEIPEQGRDPTPLRWHQIEYDVQTIEGILDGPDWLNRRYPADGFTPTVAAGLFRVT